MIRPPLACSALLSFLVAAGLLVLPGCSKKETAPAPTVRKPVGPAVTKAPEPPPSADNAAAKPAPRPPYDPAGKRDPFEPFIKAAVKGAPIDLSALPPLRRYDLGELRFVGVIWGLKTPRGLVEDPEGKGYSVAVGTRIGRMGGTVLRITDSELVVGEETRDPQGRRLVREVSLKLQRVPGGP